MSHTHFRQLWYYNLYGLEQWNMKSVKLRGESMQIRFSPITGIDTVISSISWMRSMDWKKQSYKLILILWTYFASMLVQKQIKNFATGFRNLSWEYIIKPLQKKVHIHVTWYQKQITWQSSRKWILFITSVYFPNFSNPRTFALSCDDKFGKHGRDYKESVKWHDIIQED